MSRFITKRYEGFGGNFIDSQYLGASYDTGKPYVFENILRRIYTSKSRFIGAKPIAAMIGNSGVKEIDSEIYRWRLLGAEYKCARVMEVVETGNAAPGLNGTTFRIKLDLDYFDYPDVLMGEDPEYPVQIVQKIKDGQGTIYVLKLQGDNPDRFFPTWMLEIGREFTKVWTSVQSEYNEYFGTQQYPDAFKLESQIGFFAQKLTITDKALRTDGRMGVTIMYQDATGKDRKIDRFVPYAESKMYDELYRSMDAQMLYGKKQTQAGPNGYWVKTGPGLREQLKDGHVEYYNGPLTVNRIKDYLMSIFFARENYEDRKVTAVTGTLGATMLHDALASEAASFLTLDTHFIQKYNAGLTGRHLSFGAQFSHYQGPEGIEFSLVRSPFYDSRQYCKRMHPIYAEMPVDSARMTFLDFGMSSGEPNIMMLKEKDTFRWGYTQGTVGPNGVSKGGMVTSLKAGYDIFVEGSAGVLMVDATRGGEFIYDYEF